VELSRGADGIVRRRRISRTRFNTSRRLLDLTGDGGVAIFEGARVSWRIQSASGSRLPRRAECCEHYDADKVGSPIVLRHWCRGDRFQPIGLQRPVKLQDWFTNRKVPRPQRHRLLVATTASGEVFWVEGQRIGERFKLDKRTVRRLKWAWKR
jgi:tRNA(Ile)-lysidine synthase